MFKKESVFFKKIRKSAKKGRKNEMSAV